MVLKLALDSGAALITVFPKHTPSCVLSTSARALVLQVSHELDVLVCASLVAHSRAWYAALASYRSSNSSSPIQGSGYVVHQMYRSDAGTP